MLSVIGLLSMVAAIVFLVLGIISKVKKHNSAKRNFLISGATFVIFIIALAATPSTDDAKDNVANNNPAASPASTAQASKNAEAKKKAQEEAKAKAEEEAKASEAALAAKEQIQNPEWNTSELDAMKNGNISLAMEMIKAVQNIPDGEIIATQKVYKTPWTYYGKAIAFTGTVGVVDDYPPDSEQGKSGLASEIVIECEDGSIVDFLDMVPSGDIQLGDTVTITGYPVGRTDVENKMGGTFTHLIVVTNRTN